MGRSTIVPLADNRSSARPSAAADSPVIRQVAIGQAKRP